MAEPACRDYGSSEPIELDSPHDVLLSLSLLVFQQVKGVKSLLRSLHMMAHQSAFGEFLPEIGTSSMHGSEIQAAGMDFIGIPPGRHQNITAYPMRGLLSQDFLDGAETMVDQESAAQLTGGLSLSLSKIDQSHAIIGPSHGSLDLNAVNPRHMQQQLFMAQDGMHSHSLPLQLRYSKYLVPAQELLNEFCSLGEEEMDNSIKKRPSSKTIQLEDGWTQSLSSMDMSQLQKIKAKLLYMLEEVDKRYRRYCEQMRAVRESFEATAGEDAAKVYSSLASKAMSKHFRCLRDAIAARARAVRKVIGEKDPSLANTSPAGSTSKTGETPRLKLLDQYIRRQKAFQQGMMEHHPWRPQRGLPEHAVSVLRAWLFEHFLHPYPSDMDKHILARQAGLSRSQVSNWFINARVRLWKPMVEEMYTEELKEVEADGNTRSQAASGRDQDSSNLNPNPSANPRFDQKPSQVQLLSNNGVSDSLSSVINNGSNQEHHLQRLQDSRADQGLGVMSNLEFSYGNYLGQQASARNGVSLTLGLQQHSGDQSSNLAAFSSASASKSQHSSFDQLHRSGRMEDAEMQFTLLDWETQNLIPYRNMMLQDLAGNVIR